MPDLPAKPTNEPPTEHHKRKSKQPFSAEEFKLKLMKDAGIGDERLTALVRKVIDSAEEELEATKQTPVTDHGRVTDTFEQPDYGARAKARDQLIEIIGLKKGASGEGSNHGPAVVINAPQWIQAPKPEVSVKIQAPPYVGGGAIEPLVIDLQDVSQIVSQDPSPSEKLINLDEKAR